MAAPLQTDSDRVLAFRLAGQHLARRLPPGSLLEAAVACRVQNSPPGSAALALNARVRDLTPAEINRALETDKTLLQVQSLRRAPHFFPTRDAAVFTIALLPQDEESLRYFIPGAGPAFDRIGISGTELVERTTGELLEALDGRVLTFRQLSTELTEQVSHRLPSGQLASWQSPSWYAPNQSLGEAAVHFALYVIALKGLFCFALRKGNEASFVRTDQWLGEPLPKTKPDRARAELARRYLRCYGPTTVDHFSEWAGIAPAAANRAWKMVESEGVEVTFGGRRTWLLKGDLADFESPPTPVGVRLLPPHDPYLLQRDRETLIPDRALLQLVWRRVGNPGVVLADGRIVAMWRPQKTGTRLVVTVEPLVALTGQIRSEIAAEVSLMARFRRCAGTDTVFSVDQ